MPMFGYKYDPGAEGESRTNPISARGESVSPPESIGAVQRRARGFGEAVALALAGRPGADGVAQLLAREARLVKWVSLRGALLFLVMALEDPERSLGDLRTAAGRREPEGTVDLVRQYEPRIVQLTFSQVLADSELVRTDAWHLELISWVAAAYAGAQLDAMVNIPPPQVLDIPAWYTEPVFAKAERFWDGKDWTEKCRVLQGKRYTLLRQPL